MVSVEQLTIKTDNFEFVPVVGPKALRFFRYMSAHQWKGDLSLDQYYKRESVINKAKICQPGVSVFDDTSKNSNELTINGEWPFILKDLSLKYEDKSDHVDDDDDPEFFNAVSSCALLIKDATRVSPSSSDGKVKLEAIKSATVGTVYTREHYRGKSYAKKMLIALNQWSAKFLTNDGKVRFDGDEGTIAKTNGESFAYNTLFSEIGEYYAQFGYKSFHVPLIKLPLSNDNSNDIKLQNVVPPVGEGTYQVKLLERNRLSGLLDTSFENLKRRLVENTARDNKTRLFLNLNQDTIDWFHARSFFYNDIYNDGKDIKVGLKLTTRTNNADAGNEEVLGYATWNHNFKEKSIEILTMDVFDKPGTIDANTKASAYKTLIYEIVKYFKSAQETTSGLFSDGIKIWETLISENNGEATLADIKVWLEEVLDAELGIANDSSLSAIRSFNEQDQQGLENGTVVWEANNKWGWY